MLRTTGRGRSRHRPRARRSRYSPWSASLRAPRPSPDQAITASGVVNVAPGSSRHAKASGWMPIRSLAVPNGSTSRLGQEVAGVDEAHRERLAGVLGRRGAAHGEERAVLVAGRPAQAADRLPARDEDPVMDVALARPGAAQRDELPVGVREVEDGRHRAADGQRRLAAVGERQRPGDDRAVSEQRGADGHEQTGRRVDEVDLQRLRLVAGLRVRRREARQIRLAGHDAVRGVAQVEHRRTVRALDDQRRDAEVPDARHRDLERHRLADTIGEAVERAPGPGGAARPRVAAGRRRGGARASRSRAPASPSSSGRSPGATRGRASSQWIVTRRRPRCAGSRPSGRCRHP